ncbi:TetR/AcrR family transcriptional regulator [Chachezhania sediminis]|uniref:TetR/AcrR family transcriptional regulator n=1 Tax=Chachezhania sediminis TaxID=2599291 RepID=UPI00131DC94D|nr:TetR/AcrR family transcriptional regulator [Chachezhania sediminis]
MDKKSHTRTRLMNAAEKIICDAEGSPDISVRRIAAAAGTNVASVSYHFGSLEELAVATAQRVYDRLNSERLTELQRCIDRAAPASPSVGAIVRALIGTSLRWSMDPESPYAVLQYMNRLATFSEHPEHFDPLINGVKPHRIFAEYLRRAAPWFTEEEIAWRLAAALGVRSQFTRHAPRCEVLTGRPLKGDAEPVIAELCEIIEPMFAQPARRARPVQRRVSLAPSNAV